MPDKEIRITNIDNRAFYFKTAPHLKGKHEDWHNAYIRIITRLLDDIKVQTQPVELPAFPLFSDYTQKENHFTNGLVSILKLAALEDFTFVSTFFKKLLAIEITEAVTSFQVLEGYDENSTADAVLTTINTRIFFETKIVSATLIEKQIQKHLADLKQTTEKHQYLILLTPDDSNSSYVSRHQEIDKACIKHLERKRVYEYLSNYECKTNVLRSVIKQFLSVIKDMIFKQDIVGIIAEQYNELQNSSLACPKPTR